MGGLNSRRSYVCPIATYARDSRSAYTTNQKLRSRDQNNAFCRTTHFGTDSHNCYHTACAYAVHRARLSSISQSIRPLDLRYCSASSVLTPLLLLRCITLRRRTGLVFIGILVGFIFAIITFDIFDKTVYKRAMKASIGRVAPEHRLYAAMLGSPTLPSPPPRASAPTTILSQRLRLNRLFIGMLRHLI